MAVGENVAAVWGVASPSSFSQILKLVFRVFHYSSGVNTKNHSKNQNSFLTHFLRVLCHSKSLNPIIIRFGINLSKLVKFVGPVGYGRHV